MPEILKLLILDDEVAVLVLGKQVDSPQQNQAMIVGFDGKN